MIREKEEIIKIGRILYDRGLVVARSGNISLRLDKEDILITATGTFLWNLKEEDIVKVNLITENIEGNKEPSSELKLHLAIYKNFLNNRVVLHCHPPFTNGYFSVEANLEPITFESRLYLGNIQALEQSSPNVSNLEDVISALKLNNIVVLKNHGVVSIGDTFFSALSLIEILEEAVKSSLVAKIFNGKNLDASIKKDLIDTKTTYEMFSEGHIGAIVDLVNKDEFISEKGREMDLTLRLAIKLNETDKSYTFNFEKGRITKLDLGIDAPYIISADRIVWREVFLGNLDCFAAVMQGKMKLEGSLGALSKWYVIFVRLFELFKKVSFKG